MAAVCELAESVIAQLPLLVGDFDPLETVLSQKSSCDHMTRASLHTHWTVLAVHYRLAPLLGESRMIPVVYWIE